MASNSNMAQLSTIHGHSAFLNIDASAVPAPDGGPVGVVMREMTHQGKLNIRCDKKFHTSLSKLVGLDTATDNNKFVATATRFAVWLAPDETLILTEAGAEAALAKQVTDAAGKAHISVNDVTDALTTLHLKGAKVRAMLAKGCPLDLHPSYFKEGQCAQTTLSHAGVTILALADDEMMLICRTSFTEYVVSYLCDAALEYGYELKT